MSFEQTTIFYNLVNDFKRYGEEIRNQTSRTEKAKANQALKAKIF